MEATVQQSSSGSTLIVLDFDKRQHSESPNKGRLKRASPNKGPLKWTSPQQAEVLSIQGLSSEKSEGKPYLKVTMNIEVSHRQELDAIRTACLAAVAGATAKTVCAPFTTLESLGKGLYDPKLHASKFAFYQQLFRQVSNPFTFLWFGNMRNCLRSAPHQAFLFTLRQKIKYSQETSPDSGIRNSTSQDNILTIRNKTGQNNTSEIRNISQEHDDSVIRNNTSQDNILDIRNKNNPTRNEEGLPALSPTSVIRNHSLSYFATKFIHESSSAIIAGTIQRLLFHPFLILEDHPTKSTFTLAKEIIQKHGFGALYREFPYFVIANNLFIGVYFGGYDTVISMMDKPKFWEKLSISYGVTVCANFIASPIEMVNRKRVMEIRKLQLIQQKMARVDKPPPQPIKTNVALSFYAKQLWQEQGVRGFFELGLLRAISPALSMVLFHHFTDMYLRRINNDLLK